MLSMLVVFRGCQLGFDTATSLYRKESSENLDGLLNPKSAIGVVLRIFKKGH